MADKRDQIMSAVVAGMKNILDENGYNSDLGANVFEWRPKIIDPSGSGYVPTEQDELPALHVRDPLDKAVTIEQDGSEDHDLTLELEIAHEGGATGAAMRGQIADVRKAIGVDVTWGGLASDTSREMTAETIRVQADRTFFRTLIRTKITYTTSEYAES